MTERLNDHNVSVNTQSAPGACAQIHLPSGQICELPHHHRGSWFLSSPGAAPAAYGGRVLMVSQFDSSSTP
jgi:hypothetical protein